MIKVLMIAPYPYMDQPPRGGVEAVTYNLVNALRQRDDLAVTVICFCAGTKGSEQRQLSERIHICYLSHPAMKNKRLFYYGEGRRMLKDQVAALRPDIIHFQGNGPHLLLSLDLPKHNIVVTQHGNIREEMKNQLTYKGKLIYFINSLIESYCIKQIRNFIFISAYNKSFVKKRDVDLSYRIIYNAVNPAFFTLASLPSANNRLVFVGGIRKAKGLAELLQALNALKKAEVHFELQVVGEVIEPEYKAMLDAYIKENKLEKQVTFKGLLSQPELVKLYENLQALVLPSYQECLPVSIAEAMAAGRQVIATRVGGIPEMLSGDSGIIIGKKDSKEIEQALRKIYSDDQLLRQMGTAARKFAAEKFDPAAIAKQTAEFYESLLKNYKPSRAEN